MTVISKLGRAGLVLFVISLVLLWLDWQIDKRVVTARSEGKAQCEAEFARNESKKTEREKAVQNENNHKKAVIWAKPAINDDTVQQLYDYGIL